ncbi:hypothetical protein EV182_007015 [Spiromyces aspiralis]|uniref:Uncharacterized protein n=1 Tax=Spiromyces aspiralis TaxID=68401 RepID=A0ACC1HB08_9FUNG|nr:hypothetical protein EV182_007015 [Spiromyces aspiralis]
MGQKTRNPDLFGMDDPSSLSNYKPLEPVRTPPRVEKLAERKLGDIVSTTTHHRADSPSAAHDPFQAAEISALSIQDPDTAGAQTQPKPTISRPASPTNPFATTHSLAETNPFKHLIESQHRHQHQEQ